MGKWPASGKVDAQGLPLRPYKKSVKAVMTRYDSDLSGTINTTLELQMLIVNLAYELELKIESADLERLVKEGVEELGDQSWSCVEFSEWFFQAFNFSEQSIGAKKQKKPARTNNEAIGDDVIQLMFAKYDMSGTGTVTSMDELNLLCTQLCKNSGTPDLIRAVPDRTACEARYDWSSHPWELDEFSEWFRSEFPELTPADTPSQSPSAQINSPSDEVTKLQLEVEQLRRRCRELEACSPEKLKKANAELMDAQMRALELKQNSKKAPVRKVDMALAIEDAKENAPLFLTALQDADRRAQQAEAKLQAIMQEYTANAVEGKDVTAALGETNQQDGKTESVLLDPEVGSAPFKGGNALPPPKLVDLAALPQPNRESTEEPNLETPKRHPSPAAQRGSEWRGRVADCHEEHAESQDSMWADGRSPSRGKTRTAEEAKPIADDAEGASGDAGMESAGGEQRKAVDLSTLSQPIREPKIETPKRHASPAAQRGSEWRGRVVECQDEHAGTRENMWADGRTPSRGKTRPGSEQTAGDPVPGGTQTEANAEDSSLLVDPEVGSAFKGGNALPPPKLVDLAALPPPKKESTKEPPKRHPSPAAQRGSEWRGRVVDCHEEHTGTRKSMWADGRTPSRGKTRPGEKPEPEIDPVLSGMTQILNQPGVSKLVETEQENSQLKQQLEQLQEENARLKARNPL
eukprot:TRINITY_DN2697_c0_g1_i3.p1 TRINITY_DN2697_c0_g1~~TRINITY_DN2697_c0_g1_i3.p1  ORF type:complete len:691 (+),score=131.54 TRINITY_DN2697_c0_g1_i3:126-2198(+)